MIISENDRKNYAAISLSGGKDSTCLVIQMIERGMPIDCVISADTGMEFPEMYEHLAKVDEFLFRERGIHITTLRHPQGFEYLMFEKPMEKPRSIEKRQRLGLPMCGYGWPGFRVRWCTGRLKVRLIEKEITRLKKDRNVVQYIGIAADEAWRCKDKNYPLVDWGIRRRRRFKSAMTTGLISAGCTEFITVRHVGAAPCSVLMSFGNCANSIRSYGNICGNWMTGHGSSLAPVRWVSSSQTGALRLWKNALRERRRRESEPSSAAAVRAALTGQPVAVQTKRR